MADPSGPSAPNFAGAVDLVKSVPGSALWEWGIPLSHLGLCQSAPDLP